MLEVCSSECVSAGLCLSLRVISFSNIIARLPDGASCWSGSVFKCKHFVGLLIGSDQRAIHLSTNPDRRKSLCACGRASVVDVQFPDGAPVEVGDLEGVIIAFAENRSFFSPVGTGEFLPRRT